MTRTDKARTVLSDWRLWMTLSFFGLASVVVALWFAFGKIAREEAFRAADMKATNVTQVGECFTSAKNGPVTKGFVAGIKAVIDSSLIANQQALKAEPTGPLAGVRSRSVDRLEPAQRNVKALKRLINKSIPTRKKCVALAAKLHVDAYPYLQAKGTR